MALDAWFDANAGRATLSDVADHIDHVRDVAGIDHSASGATSTGRHDAGRARGRVAVSGAVRGAGGRGYGEEDLVKIAGRNVLRVMRDVEQTGVRLRAERPPSTRTIEQELTAPESVMK